MDCQPADLLRGHLELDRAEWSPLEVEFRVEPVRPIRRWNGRADLTSINHSSSEALPARHQRLFESGSEVIELDESYRIEIARCSAELGAEA